MTANADGLSKGLESISFADAQRDPNLLNPTAQIASSSKKSRRSKGNDGAKRAEEAAIEDVGQPIKQGKSRSVRRKLLRKRKSAEMKGMHVNGDTIEDQQQVNGAKSFSLPPKPQSSMPKLGSPPLQPRAMAVNGSGANSKAKKVERKSKDSQIKSNDGSMNKDENKRKITGQNAESSITNDNKSRDDKGSEKTIVLSRNPTLPPADPDAAKRKEVLNRRAAIAQNENAIAQAFALLTMQANADFERDYGILWCQDMRKEAFPQDTDQDFRNRVIGKQVSNLWRTTRPSEYILRMREKVIKDVQEHIDRRWPGCDLRVAPFGSTQTGLVEASSDIDLCLLDPTRPRGVGTPRSEVLPLPNPKGTELLHNERIIGIPDVPDYYNVGYLARALERYSFSFKQVQPIRHAKVPIVKFVHADSGLEGDLNVNDSFGLQNSDMINHYIDICPNIVAPLLFFIKKWAARRHINDPSGKSGIVSLNSYTLTVFGLQYLQLKGIVPNLQSPSLIRTLNVPEEYLWQRPKGSFASRRRGGIPMKDESDGERIEVDPDMGGRKFDTTFCRLKTNWDFSMAEQDSSNWRVGDCEAYSMKPALASEEENDRLLGSLLEGFFEWLASFDFDNCGISLREGHPIRRVVHLSESDNANLGAFPYVKQWDPTWKENAILCQDPFILDRNTCGAVLDTTQVIIANEAKRAHRILTQTKATPQAVSPLLSDLMIDWEYEQLLENHKQVTKGWEPERVAYIKKEAKMRSNDPDYNPSYNRIRDKRAREAQKQIAAKRVETLNS